jgi:hypothetical protein
MGFLYFFIGVGFLIYLICAVVWDKAYSNSLVGFRRTVNIWLAAGALLICCVGIFNTDLARRAEGSIRSMWPVLQDVLSYCNF